MGGWGLLTLIRRDVSVDQEQKRTWVNVRSRALLTFVPITRTEVEESATKPGWLRAWVVSTNYSVIRAFPGIGWDILPSLPVSCLLAVARIYERCFWVCVNGWHLWTEVLHIPCTKKTESLKGEVRVILYFTSVRSACCWNDLFENACSSFCEVTGYVDCTIKDKMENTMVPTNFVDSRIVTDAGQKLQWKMWNWYDNGRVMDTACCRASQVALSVSYLWLYPDWTMWTTTWELRCEPVFLLPFLSVSITAWLLVYPHPLLEVFDCTFLQLLNRRYLLRSLYSPLAW